MAKNKYEFGGWATRNDIVCSDGRIIRQNAFKDNDGEVVPLVWNHQHNDSDNVLGHALLENRPEGVYTYLSFNDTEKGQNARKMVEHGDISSLSIFANKLKSHGHDVVHGMIREVSLVLAGANPGAFIDTALSHSDDSEEEGTIYSGMNIESSIAHSEDGTESEDYAKGVKETNKENDKKMAEKTVQDVIDGMTEEEKNVMYALIGMAAEGKMENKEGDDDEDMKHNVFDNDYDNQDEQDALMHSEVMAALKDGKSYGSLKDSFIAHGIDDIEYLFPDARELNKTPEFIKRDTTWVGKVMNSVHKSPFSRLKSTFANITEDEARAKGYLKGNMKKEEVFSLLKRTTQPTTVYKKQKLDRDDVVDITDFDVVAWIKTEMRGMLDEELARAFLLGDGRLASDDDHIDTNCIRPVINDSNLFAIKVPVKVATNATEDDIATEFIKACIKSRKKYKGSGSPSLYTTEDNLTNMLLLTDTTGRDLYDSQEKLSTKLRAKEIITVEPMEGVKYDTDKPLLGVMLNFADYDVGADKGGAVNMFDDFDIDFNQQKYLIETRCSGSLMKPYSAIVFYLDKTL